MRLRVARKVLACNIAYHDRHRLVTILAAQQRIYPVHRRHRPNVMHPISHRKRERV